MIGKPDIRALPAQRVEVALPDSVLTEEKKGILENIAAKLYSNRKFMQRAIEKFAG